MLLFHALISKPCVAKVVKIILTDKILTLIYDFWPIHIRQRYCLLMLKRVDVGCMCMAAYCLLLFRELFLRF